MKLTYFTTVTLLLFIASQIFAQDTSKKLNYQFYGFVRGDASYDTRQSVSAFEGLLLLYPQDVNKDANGEDLNEVASSGFYSFNTRAGVNVGGLNVFNADVTSRIEADFAGFGGPFGSNSSVFRIRQAFMKMQWQQSSLLLGQTWHPLFSPVFPDVISLSVGAPFSPFNRSPQIRYDYKFGNLTLTGAGVYQFQSTSNGPLGKTTAYQRNAILPELFAGVDYSEKHFTGGVALDYLTLKPRTQSTMGGKVYKVDESLSSLSFSAYLKYKLDLFAISAKSIYGQNLSDMTMIGGYGISNIDAVTGKQEYTNFNHSSTWLNLAYGKKYLGNIFVAYSKNLGTDKALIQDSNVYGEGLKLNDLYRVCGTFTYNIPHFSIGLEYEMTTANYGDTDTFDYSKGKYDSSHGVTNHRLVGVISYLF